MYDPELAMRWRLRAQQTRIHAAKMKDRDIKVTMLAMADHWDHKASEAERPRAAILFGDRSAR
jgi:hypothetical protein